MVHLDTRRLGGGLEMWKWWLPNERYVTNTGGNLNRLKINHTLDVAKKEVYTAVLAAQESKLQEFTADLQSESGRKNCFRVAIQMAREGRDVISVCCMKYDVENVVSDADGMKNIWRKYMEKLLNVENYWDGEVDCPGVTGPCCLISEEEVAAAIKGLKIGKAAGPTGVVSEMMKAAGGFGSRWMTDPINNIVKEGCIPDDWRKSILVPVYKGKGDPLVCGSYRAIKLLEQPMKVLERVLEKKIRCQVSIDNMQFGFMPFINSRLIKFTVSQFNLEYSQSVLEYIRPV